MKKQHLSQCRNHFLICSILTVYLFTACGGNGETTGLDNCPVVATTQIMNGESLIVCDFSLMKDSIDLPVSLLVEDLEIIRLENSDEALTGEGAVYVSDNYIGIYSYNSGYKLYDRQGNYITEISKRGQGPYEYFIAIYDSFIDEKHGLIYIISFRADVIMAFNLDGTPEFTIPLPFTVHKARFRVNYNKKQVEVVALPFPDTPSVAWVQDFDGNIIHQIAAGHFVISPPDYSNEVFSVGNGEVMDFSTFYWVPRADTLYHYQPENNRLIPRFTVNFKDDTPKHSLKELPGCFIFDICPEGVKNYPTFIVDKKSLKGSQIIWQIDQLGNIEGSQWKAFGNGYYICNMYPHVLKEQLAGKLKNPEKLTSEQLVRMKELYLSIGEDDNNILLLGKLK